jgi:hypothetical protein
LSASSPGHFTPGEIARRSQWIEGWVGPRTGLDDVEKRKILTLPGLEICPLARPPRSQSLYRLRYPDLKISHVYVLITFSALFLSLFPLFFLHISFSSPFLPFIPPFLSSLFIYSILSFFIFSFSNPISLFSDSSIISFLFYSFLPRFLLYFFHSLRIFFTAIRSIITLEETRCFRCCNYGQGR